MIGTQARQSVFPMPPMRAARHPMAPGPSNDTPTSTQHPPFPTYRAWSERECRWVPMTFDEYQAWLARPDLDPVEFASGELAS